MPSGLAVSAIDPCSDVLGVVPSPGGEAMRRREFIASAWPLAVRAQQSVMPTIGFLSGASSGNYQPFVTAFKEGLKQTDYVEERNVAIEYRWAEGQFDRLPKLAADLVDDRPTVIMAGGNAAAWLPRGRPRRFRSFSRAALTPFQTSSSGPFWLASLCGKNPVPNLKRAGLRGDR